VPDNNQPFGLIAEEIFKKKEGFLEVI